MLLWSGTYSLYGFNGIDAGIYGLLVYVADYNSFLFCLFWFWSLEFSYLSSLIYYPLYRLSTPDIKRN